MITLGHARAIARATHYGQVDKGGEPYINHCIRVANQMETKEEKVVATLHDVLEDSPKYGYVIGGLIGWRLMDTLTLLARNDSLPYHDYIVYLATDPIARKVKIADLRDNLDPSRAANISESQRERYNKALDYLLTVE